MVTSDEFTPPSQWDLPPPDSSLTVEHRVRGHEAGVAGNLKFVNGLHYLQEAAEMHADQIGVGLTFLRSRGMLWVLSRYHVRLDHYPMIGDSVRIITWPSGFRRLWAEREFLILGDSDRIFGAASSAWLLVRADDFRPLRSADHLPGFEMHTTRPLPSDFPKIPAPIDPQFKRTFRVRMHDLDVNRHVNNAVYVEWALEAVPEPFWNRSRPAEVEVQFAGMAMPGDTVEAKVRHEAGINGDTFLHEIRRTSDDRILTAMRSRWTQVQP